MMGIWVLFDPSGCLIACDGGGPGVQLDFPVWAQREVGEAEKETKTQQSEREVAYILFLAILYFQWRIFTAGVTAIFTQAASSTTGQ
jgi:hypothetical protein